MGAAVLTLKRGENIIGCVLCMNIIKSEFIDKFQLECAIFLFYLVH